MNLIELLQTTFSSDFFTIEPNDLLEYGKDWTKIYTPDPLVICFPKSTEEVSKLLKLANDLNMKVVPSGGRTGLSGGAVAAEKEIVLSLSKMRKISKPDVLSRTIEVEAGAITEAVHEKCAEYGLTWPVDFASKGSSTVGGNIATNAGGVNVIRYGLTRNWVLGLTVVLMDGTILKLNGALEKNNTGIDLRQIFIGSEGILGVITEALLKCAPAPLEKEVYLFSTNSLETVLKVFEVARRSPFQLNAFEFFTDKCLKRVKNHLGVKPPFSTEGSHTVLVDVEKNEFINGEKWLEEILSLDGVLDGVVSQSSDDVKNFWKCREGISESLSSTGFPHKNDIALPIQSLKGFCEELEGIISNEYPDFEICNFGHIGDGNLHLNIMKPDGMSVEDFKLKTKSVDEVLFPLVQKWGGSVSAEHGIGLLKKPYLHFTRTEAEISIFKGFKKLLDPKGLLNPGKVF